MSLDFFRGQPYQLPENAFSSPLIYAGIQSFCQYRMAPTTVSVLSYGLNQKLSVAEKDKLWDDLLAEAGIPNDNFVFSSLLWSREKELTDLKLTDSTFTCDQIKGAIRWDDSLIEFGNKMSKLDLLFLRIRNAFAHGRVAAMNGFLVFEDRDSFQQLSARIVLNEKTLLLWMKMIQSRYVVPKDDVAVMEELSGFISPAKKNTVSQDLIASRGIDYNTILELRALCDPADGQRLEKEVTGFYSGTYYIVPYQKPIETKLRRFLKTAYIPINKSRDTYLLEVYVVQDEHTILIPEDIFHFCEREIVLTRRLKIKGTTVT